MSYFKLQRYEKKNETTKKGKTMAIKKQPCKVSSSTFVRYLFSSCSVIY